MKVWCACGATFTASGPEHLWAFVKAHTTERVEATPGVRRKVELHNLYIFLGDSHD